MSLAEIKSKLAGLSISPPVSTQQDVNGAACINAHNAKVLQRLTTILDENTDDTIVAVLERFLAENWTVIQGTLLCYTAQPDCPITDLLCDIAAFVAEEKNRTKQDNEERISLLQILMPTVARDSLFPWKYPNLVRAVDRDVDIKAILKKHIVGRDGQFLIPIAYLQDYDDSIGFKPIVNPYFDVFVHPPELTYLSENELRRLVEHSPLTKDLYEAKLELEAASNSENNLLGRLRHLSTHMKFNSADGVGQEDAAGADSALVVLDFLDYYENLSADNKALVPFIVKQEIQEIKDHSSGAKRGVASCIFERRRDLVKAIRGNESTLSSIGASKEELITKAKEKLAVAKSKLLKALCDNYNGSDKLGIPLRLVEQLKIRLSFQTPQHLYSLTLLSDSEITQYCSNEGYKQAIIKAIGSIENLVMLSKLFSTKQLESFLKALEPDLFSTYFTGARELALAIMILNRDKKVIFLQLYKERLANLVHNSDDMNRLFAVMEPDEQMSLYNDLKPKFKEIIPSFFYLPGFLIGLPANERLELLNLFKDHELERMSKTDLLSKDQLIKLYQQLEATLPEFPLAYEADLLGSDLHWFFAIEFAKVAAVPAAKRYLWSPFPSCGAFFEGAYLPFVGYGLALSVAIITIIPLMFAIKELLQINLSSSISYLMCASVCLAGAALLTVLATAFGLIMGTGFVLRSIHTIGSRLVGEGEDRSTENTPAVAADNTDDNPLSIVAAP